MWTAPHPPPDFLGMGSRVPRRRPDRELAPAAMSRPAPEDAPGMPAGERARPLILLRKLYRGLDVLVRMPGPRSLGHASGAHRPGDGLGHLHGADGGGVV